LVSLILGIFAAWIAFYTFPAWLLAFFAMVAMLALCMP